MSYLARLKARIGAEKMQDAPGTEVTKPTKPGFGSFGTSLSGPSEIFQGVADAIAAPHTWGADDWRTFFDERAGIREFDGGHPRLEAEWAAIQDSIDHWLAVNPPTPTSPEAGCVMCGGLAGDLLPHLAQGGHFWVHGKCWGKYWAGRRHVAAQALREFFPEMLSGKEHER